MHWCCLLRCSSRHQSQAPKLPPLTHPSSQPQSKKSSSNRKLAEEERQLSNLFD